MGRKPKAEEYSAKHRITLDELAAHDDVCSDVMIDNAYYKSRIRKNKPKHIPVRGIKEDEIPQILLHKIIVEKDVFAAEKALMKLPGLMRYYKFLRNKNKQENFLNHLRKYIYMYQTDCPFEVSTTNRYTITTYEAAVTARKRLKPGEKVKYLVGTLVPLTTEESLGLDLTNRNFSIVVSGRKKSDHMFLGPARFANHDCDANARLVMRGNNESMEVEVVKHIDVGDEITVSYGDNYFGPENAECLCHTCEVKEINGWASKPALTQANSGSPTPTTEAGFASQTQSKKRKRDGESTSPSQSRSNGLKRLKSLTSPSKLQYSWTPLSTSESEIAQEDNEDRMHVEEHPLPSPVSNEEAKQSSMTPQRDGKGRFIPSSSKSSSPKRGSAASKLLGKGQKSFPLTPSSTSPSSEDSEQRPSALTSDDPQSQKVVIKIEAVEKTVLEMDHPSGRDKCELDLLEKDQLDRDTIRARVQSSSGSNNEEYDDYCSAPQAIATLTMTKISTILDQPPVSPTWTPSENSASAVLPSIEAAPAIAAPTTIKQIASTKLTITPVTDTVRIPGDYILTRKLLAQPHDRWVRCHNEKCLSFFLQPNGYQTRRECSRCERHSMLYGFPWPKTDPDARKLLAREKEKKNRGPGRPSAAASEKAKEESKYTAFRRQGRCGKGTWVEGGGDEEERVMDHRTIHRFVLPEEERELARKGLLVEAEQARKMGEEGLGALAMLDGRAQRFRDEGLWGLRESTGRESSEGLWESEDGEGRRRSNRVVESRVYVNVDMKR